MYTTCDTRLYTVRYSYCTYHYGTVVILVYFVLCSSHRASSLILFVLTKHKAEALFIHQVVPPAAGVTGAALVCAPLLEQFARTHSHCLRPGTRLQVRLHTALRAFSSSSTFIGWTAGGACWLFSHRYFKRTRTFLPCLSSVAVLSHQNWGLGVCSGSSFNLLCTSAD